MAGRHLRGDAQALARMERKLGSEAHIASAWVAKGDEIAKRIGPCNLDVLVAFERALNLDPTLASAWLGYAMALRANRNYEDTLDAEAKALALDLENPLAWLSRSRTLSLLSRREEALAALETAMRLSPDAAEDWRNWDLKQSLLHSLKREDEAGAARQRYRALLEIAAGAIPAENNATLSPAQRQVLVERIYYDEGSLEEQERWLAIIQRQEALRQFPEMEGLRRIVVAKRLAARLREELGSPLNREQLVTLVQRLMSVEGTEEEQDAWLNLIAEEAGAAQESAPDGKRTWRRRCRRSHPKRENRQALTEVGLESLRL
jgi:tetratricopeptide (TPR) repeat protein